MNAAGLTVLACTLTILTGDVSPQETESSECQSRKVELVFLQDASHSVSPDSFEMSKVFIADTARQLPVGPDDVRVALVRFGSQADVITGLNRSSDVTAVTDAVAGMAYVVGGTDTALALMTVREQVLTDARPDASAVVVIITDGASDNRRLTKGESQRLRDQHVRLVWLYTSTRDGTGREREFMMRRGDRTLGVKSFQELGPEITRQIVNATCEESSEPYSATTEEPPTTPSKQETSSEVITADLGDAGSGDIESPFFQTTPPRSNSPRVVTSLSSGGTTHDQAQEEPSEPPSYNSRQPALPSLNPLLNSTATVEEESNATVQTSENRSSLSSASKKTPNYTIVEVDSGSGDIETGLTPHYTQSPGPTSVVTTQQGGEREGEGEEKEKAAETKEGVAESSWSLPSVLGVVFGVLAVAGVAATIAYLVRRRKVGKSNIEQKEAQP